MLTRQSIGPSIRRLLPFLLLIAAAAFVVHAVPIRDRCRPAESPAAAFVPTTRDNAGCTSFTSAGAVRLSRQECQALVCEPGALSTFGGAKLEWMLLAAALYTLSTFAWAGRWSALLGFAGVKLNVLRVWRISTEAQAMGIILPGGVGGDALRVASIVSLPHDEGARGETQGQTITTVITSVLLDRAIGLTAIGTVAAVASLSSGGQTGRFATTVFALFPVAFATGVFVLQSPRWQRIPWLVESVWGKRLRPLFAYLGDPRAPRAILKGFGISLVLSTCVFLCVRVVVHALGGEPLVERWIYIGAAMAMMVGALPLSPGGWGTTDAAYVAFLANAGLPASVALGVSLSLRLFWYGTALVGGLLYAARKRRGAMVVAASTTSEPPP